MIYVYSEPEAIHPRCVEEITSRLLEYGVPPQRIREVDTNQLSEVLNQNTGTLILPGGNTLKVSFCLDKPLATKIFEAVARGWNCLGFCAGANVLCQEVLLRKKGQPDTACSPFCSLVGLLPQISYVPAILVDTYGAQENCRVVSLRTSDGRRFSSYWNEGSYFQNSNFWTSPRSILAYYDEGEPALKPAILTDCRGRGKVTVCGPHPEFPIENETAENREARIQFLWNLFQSAGIRPTLSNQQS